MMVDTFGHHPWTVQDLVAGVSSGRVRLPDIQRPFVWGNAKVRDLVDSMYRGFPVGQLMFWENTAAEHTKVIGIDTRSQNSSMQVVDGQQRLTSLYAMVHGRRVLREDYSEEPELSTTSGPRCRGVPPRRGQRPPGRQVPTPTLVVKQSPRRPR
jgi:hypothetical protein